MPALISKPSSPLKDGMARAVGASDDVLRTYAGVVLDNRCPASRTTFFLAFPPELVCNP